MAGYVLIVDSNVDLQNQIGAALRDAGFELAAETDGAWAKRSIAVRAPDAVVLGTQLRDGDGFRLAEELRHDPDTRTVPIVFIASTHRGASHRAEARRRFAPADYLMTPLDVSAVVPSITELCAGGSAATPTPTPVDEIIELDADQAQEEEQEAQQDEQQLQARELEEIGETPPPEPAGAETLAPTASLRDPVQQRERRDVERSAKTLVADPAKPEVAGTLKRTPFARVLQRLYTERATGSLLLLRDPTKKIVSFAGGYPVSVRSNVANETLGQILLEKHLIGPDVLAESVKRMLREKRQQGQILIEMGVLSPFNLERALVDQLEAKLLEIFSWPDGKFIFKAGDAPPPTAVRLERPPAALILEGIRRNYDLERQNGVLEQYAGHRIGLASDPVVRLQDITSDSTELDFVRSIDGRRRVSTLLDQAAIPAEKARLLLVALSECGMIQATEVTSRSKAGPAPGPGTPSDRASSASGPMSTGATGAAPLSAGQLAMMLQTARTQDYFWVLGLERSAVAAEIDRAYESLARSFHPDRYHLAPGEDRKAAQEIFDRLADAHRTLRDPARRRAYAAKLDRAEEAAAPATPETPAVPAMPTGAAVSPSPSGTAARVLYENGLEHLRARRHHEAVEALRQAARLIPNEADFRAALGWALFRQAPADARAGRAAVAELRRALQLDERNRNAAQRLAEIYAQTGQPELAIQELERALAFYPGDLEIADELRRLRAR
jgi:DNA-binding response OmpR family regulator/tetratricopeptide (TPR) repeat protein